MSLHPFFHVDESLWPVVVFEMHSQRSPPDEALAMYLETLERYAREGEQFLVITDVSRAGILTGPQRRYQSEWRRRNEDLLTAMLLGNVYVMSSPFQRLCLNVVFNLKPPRYPHTVVSQLRFALLWSVERLEAANLGEAAARVRGHPALLRAAGAD